MFFSEEVNSLTRRCNVQRLEVNQDKRPPLSVVSNCQSVGSVAERVKEPFSCDRVITIT